MLQKEKDEFGTNIAFFVQKGLTEKMTEQTVFVQNVSSVVEMIANLTISVACLGKWRIVNMSANYCL